MLVSHLEAYELELRERLRSINRARRDLHGSHLGVIPVRSGKSRFSFIKPLIAYVWQTLSYRVRTPK